MLNNDVSHDLFVVHLQGELVSCDSLDDAVAVKTANDILRWRTEADYPPRELERLAAVLIRYRRDAEAKTLSHLSCRMRAADFLVDRMAYEPPVHQHKS